MLQTYHLRASIPAGLRSWLIRSRLALRLFRNAKVAGDDDSPSFFIIGSGRSGNTLLRSMLTAGEQVCIPPESYVLPRCVVLYRAYACLPWPRLASLVLSEFEAHPEFTTWRLDLREVHSRARTLARDKQTFSQIIALVYEHYRNVHHPSAQCIGDKTPINTIFLRVLRPAFPYARYIHLLRDPRASVASYKQAGMKSVEQATDYWLTATRNAAKLGADSGPERYLRIEYEALVMDPSSVLEEVCGFLGVCYRGAMLDYWKHDHYLGDVERRSHHINTLRPLSTASIDGWKDTLSLSELKHIERRCLNLYNRLGAEKNG
jgi:protein-tyrosine sulfotransferase